MKKFIASILLSVLILPLFAGNGFAAVQSVAGVTVALDAASGQIDGVSFTGAGTVTVTDGQPLNSNANATGVATSVDNQGNLTFAGSSVVTGVVGTAPLSLNTITASGGAGKTVSFLGNVFADTNAILNGTGTLAFGGNYTGTTLYNAGSTGTITLAAAKTMTGAISNTATNEGVLTLGAGSSVVGAVGSAGAGLNVINLSGAAASITGATKATTVNLSGAGSFITGATTATTINMSAATTSITGAVTATNLNLTGGNASIVGATAVTNYGLNGNTLAIDGAVTVPATGNVALTASSGTAFGKITSTGLATVTAGATATVNVTGFVAGGTQMVILDGTGGASVAPNLVVTSTSPNVTFTSNAGAASDWTLTATRTNVASTPQASAVTTTINASAPTGDLLTVVNAIDALTSTSAVNAAVVQLDPTNNGAMSQAVFSTANETVGALTTHLGEAGDNTENRQSGVSTGDFWLDNGIWAKGFGNSTEQDTHKGINGYDSKTWGLIGGIDGIVTDDVLVGIAGGYAATSIDNQSETGGTDVDSYIGTIYMSYDDPSPWYGDLGLTFAWNSFDSTRRIAFTGIDRVASSSTDGQTYTAFGDVGYVIPVNETWNVTPMAGLTYSHINIDGYTETGAGALSLNVGDQEYDQLLSSLGVKLDAEFETNSGKWVPEVHAKWLYDFIGDKVATTSSFTGGGASFSTNGLDPEQSTYNLGAGVTFYSKGSVSITGTYDYQFGDDYVSHTGVATVRYTF